jgi:transcriptional regulator with XRE-family HTH domain
MTKPRLGRPAGRLLFAEGFEALRAVKGLAKKDIAEEAGISPQFLADLLAYRAGASPEAQQAIADAMGLAIEALFPEATGWVGPLVNRKAARTSRRPPRTEA